MKETAHPIVVKLADKAGFALRKKAAEYLKAYQNKTGAERGRFIFLKKVALVLSPMGVLTKIKPCEPFKVAT